MTNLESAILNWYSENYSDIGLGNLEYKLTVSHREITEVGFFTYFNSVTLNFDKDHLGCIPGPFINSSQIPSGAMSVLSLSGKEVKFLEVMSMDDEDDANQIEEFHLGEQF